MLKKPVDHVVHIRLNIKKLLKGSSRLPHSHSTAANCSAAFGLGRFDELRSSGK